MTQLPNFATLDEEVTFWENNDSADYWDELEEVSFEREILTNLLHPKLTVLERHSEQCPRSHEWLQDKVIEYMIWNEGHLMMIRDVPIFHALVAGHEYILEDTLMLVMRLLRQEKMHQIQPITKLEIPVFSLNSN